MSHVQKLIPAKRDENFYVGRLVITHSIAVLWLLSGTCNYLSLTRNNQFPVSFIIISFIHNSHVIIAPVLH